ncbi:hypothetical protein CKO31_01895 [Thiohalocapsa halophila]|uniref:Uncharacterized protein n=1 Tax=Thiohalocapsa halophila TaxID=69359 RepID=A0ABS1CC87_9GAMM|nr:hypothetical protein [Thiohalocapsa halophila]MBK1629508.1 hypothetical protein [Thiohalocapsa halophila]
MTRTDWARRRLPRVRQHDTHLSAQGQISAHVQPVRLVGPAGAPRAQVDGEHAAALLHQVPGDLGGAHAPAAGDRDGAIALGSFALGEDAHRAGSGGADAALLADRHPAAGARVVRAGRAAAGEALAAHAAEAAAADGLGDDAEGPLPGGVEIRAEAQRHAAAIAPVAAVPAERVDPRSAMPPAPPPPALVWASSP